jgi:hypothetical protein
MFERRPFALTKIAVNIDHRKMYDPDAPWRLASAHELLKIFRGGGVDPHDERIVTVCQVSVYF